MSEPALSEKGGFLTGRKTYLLELIITDATTSAMISTRGYSGLARRRHAG